MSDEKALLGAIWEHPHDDTVRLAYADWLQEAGGASNAARAEFIRLQCALAKLDDWDDGAEPLKVRIKPVWKRWGRRWRARLPEPHRECEFRRGFPHFDLTRYEIPDAIKLTVGDIEAAPLSVCHYNVKGTELADFLAWPGLRFQDRFSPRPPRLPTDWVRKVVECPALRNVSELCTIDCPLAPDEVKLLLDAWADRHLPNLSLAGPIGDEGLAVLAAHPTLAKVRRLDLRGHRGTAAGVRVLGVSSFLGSVRELNLSSSAAPEDLIHELVRWPIMPAVRRLSLGLARVTTAGALALADAPALADLRELVLGFNSIGAAGCRALARSPHLNRLTLLTLHSNPGVRNARVQKELRARFPTAVNL